MVKYLKNIRPESVFTHFLYISINALLPVIVFGLVRLEFIIVAIIIVILSKWRMFAVKPRYWLVNLRSNLVDIFVGLSIVAFMAGTHNIITQLVWTILYIAWLVWLKPKSKPIPVMFQALIAQTLGVIAFYAAFPNVGIYWAVITVWLVCYSSARHFLGAFDDDNARQLTHVWAWFGAGLAWILGHWVIYYFSIPQIALVLAVISYGISVIYYLHYKHRLKPTVKNQIIAFMFIILLIIIVFSDWQYKTI